MKPLRYTPGLSCDPHLESLRPSRDMKHQPFQGGDEYKKKLIRTPKTFEGSFADADMEQFRPVPNPPPITEDPWYSSRVPEGQNFAPLDRLAGAHYPVGTNPYDQVRFQQSNLKNSKRISILNFFQAFPQDELSRIKMRNRRFQNSCGQEMMMGGPPPQAAAMPMQHSLPMYGYGMPPQPVMYNPMAPGMMMMPQQPMMPLPQMMPMMQPPQQQGVLGDLQMLDDELNTTRRLTRPFVPSDSPEFSKLQRARNIIEDPANMSMPLPTPKIRT